MMLKDGALLRKMEADLCLNVPFVKGQVLNINNCWHFSSDGESVELMFYDDIDFRDGMNRIYVVLQSFNVVILAFCLMNTHVHFLLYGEFDECNRFIHEYLRRTSLAIERRHKRSNALASLKLSHQNVAVDSYLKTVICYVCRNAPVAGLPYTYYDYPWCSGPLYFRHYGEWTEPRFCDASPSGAGTEELKLIMKTKHVKSLTGVRMIDDLVFPGEYVAVGIVERIFKTCKAFNYIMGRTREDEVEARGGDISRLSIPIQEMRQYRDEMCIKLFGSKGLRGLDTARRLRLARALKSQYNSSVKQIARVCGLVISEVEKLM